MEIFEEVATRYLKMGAGQILRDFRRDYHIRKSLAHRKTVLIRKEKDKRRRIKVHLSQIEQDRSHRKRSSHVRLLALINDVNEDVAQLYKKTELQHLCDGYKVNYLKSWNKGQLANALIKAIPLYDHIPCHQVTSVYTEETMEIDDSDRRMPILVLHRI